MDNILNRVETAIKTHDSKLMRMLALDIESELLEKTRFPEWCLDLFIRLFNDEKFCSVSREKGSGYIYVCCVLP